MASVKVEAAPTFSNGVIDNARASNNELASGILNRLMKIDS